MKVIIPIAGLGSRLKPHTYTTPKPLMDVAGKPILDYIIKEVDILKPSEIIFIVGYKRQSIENYINKFYPKLNITFVEQEERNGDGSAIRLGLENINEEDNDEDLLIVFGDTLIDFDIKKSINKDKKSDAIIFGMEVDDPSHYGIMNINSDLMVTSVEEKPNEPKSNLAIIGAYYFKSFKLLNDYLEDFYRREETINDEYKIIQVIEKYVEKEELVVKASKVKEWFDCGRPEVLLEANKYFLTKNSNNKNIRKQGSSLIIAPSYVSSSAILENSIIGPYASIGKESVIKNSIIKNSIINIKALIENESLDNSLIGKEVFLRGKFLKINVGDKSEINFD